MTNHVGTVGIVMPMYNARQTVLRAVQSVMNQTWPDWHLYLINDKSTDDSLALVREHCNDPRITILDNEVNLGAAETRNVGLRAAKEEIIAFLDSDDEWHVDKLAQQAAAIAAGDDFVITEYHYKTKKRRSRHHLQQTLSATGELCEEAVSRLLLLRLLPPSAAGYFLPAQRARRLLVSL